MGNTLTSRILPFAGLFRISLKPKNILIRKKSVFVISLRSIEIHCNRYSGVIMGAMASQITGVSICSSVGSGADQRKHQSSASLAFVRWIHRWPVNFPAHNASNAGYVFIWWRHHDRVQVDWDKIMDVFDKKPHCLLDIYIMTEQFASKFFFGPVSGQSLLKIYSTTV